MWRRKAHVQIISVLFGAFLGSFTTLMDRNILEERHWQEFPHFTLETAILSSTIANAISFWYY